MSKYWQSCNQILLDLLDWIRRFQWWESGGSSDKPFGDEVESLPGKYGRLRRYSSRDTPRTVRTWIFEPYQPKDRQRPNSIQIFCDFLEAIPGKPSSDRRTRRIDGSYRRYTHRLEVLEVIQDTNLPSGEFEYRELYSGEFDWQVRANRRDEFAIPITDEVAKKLLHQPLKETHWEWEVRVAAQLCMRGEWKQSSDSEKIRNVTGIILDNPPKPPDQIAADLRRRKRIERDIQKDP